MQKYVYDFTEGDRTMGDLLGGKGANLAEMTKLGLPVPPGFTITTEACKEYMHLGHEPQGMAEQVAVHLAATESRVGRKFGDARDPLLVSVRSGAKFSMPGMMETVLNIGLNDETIAGLIAATGSDRFAWDSYRRLIQMFGKTVLGIESHYFELVLDGLDDGGVAMAGVQHRDAPGEVDVATALDVPDLGVVAALDENLVGMTDATWNGGLAAGKKGGVVQMGVALHGGPSGAMTRDF